MQRVLLLVLLLSARLVAGETEEAPAPRLHLTLHEAIARALQKNFAIEAERLSPLIAEAQLKGAQGVFDPRLEVRGSRTQRTTDFGGGDFPDDEPGRLVTQNDSYFAGITGLTPLGTQYEAGLSASRTGNSENEWAGGLRFGLSQPLLRNFGPAANLSQIRISRLDAQGSEWQLRQRVIDVITQTFFVYNEIYFATENLRAAERSRELARRLLGDNEKRAEIGVMSPLDITSARAEAAAREEGAILARRQIRDNENFLKQLVTQDAMTLLGTEITVEPPPLPDPTAIDVGRGIRDALLLRPDYQQAQLELQRRNINLAFSRNQALPRFDLTGSLDLNGVGGGTGDAFRGIGRGDDQTWSAGGVISVPIPNRQGAAGIEVARLSVRQALIELQRLEQDIIVRVDNAAGQVRTSRERVHSDGESRRLAEESLAAGEERLRAGAGTTFEVLELQQRLAEAEAASIRARGDLNNSLSEYQRQTGTTLRENQVELAR